MSRDADLIVSCKCGKISIVKEGGYHSSDFIDAVELGVEAERLCRRKRLKGWLVSLGIPLLTGAILIGGTGWWWGTKAVGVAEHKLTAEHHLLKGFSYYQDGDYDAAIRECDEALKLEPWNEAAKQNRSLAMKYLKP